MSMLAGPRNKANYVLNPKNSNWAADTSKYGLRILEKMGWTEGSGLGANEQGSTDFIKVTVPTDYRGLGFKSRPEDELLHQSDFSDLLQQLASDTSPLEGSGEENKSGKIASLEEKSQMSRSRVHYRKFTRGKDLSRYSEKDLANIVGKPGKQTKFDSENKFDSETKFETQQGSMYDYFRNKMAGREWKASSGEPCEVEGNGMSEMNGTDDDFVETNEGKKAKKVLEDAQQCLLQANSKDVENLDGDAETRKEKKRRRKAEKRLKNSEQVTKSENTNDVKSEKGVNSQLESMSVSNGSEGAVDGAETKKERKRKRRAEKVLKDAEQLAEVEGAASVEGNTDNVMESKQKLKSTLEDNGKVEENDKSVADAETLAESKREKKRLRKVQRALQNSQQGTELEITTDSAEHSSNRKTSVLASDDPEQAEGNDKARENRKRKKKNKKESKSAEDDSELLIESKSADIATEVTQTRKPKKSRKELDQGTDEVNQKSEDLSDSKIELGKKQKRKKKYLNDFHQEGDVEKDSMVVDENMKVGKHKKRKMDKKEGMVVNDNIELDSKSAKRNTEKAGGKFHSEDDIVGFNKRQKVETETPIASDVGHPEFFCDARSKKAKMKGKEQNLTASPQPGVDGSDKLVGISNGDIGNSQNGRKRKDRGAPGSETLDGTTIVVNEENERGFGTKREGLETHAEIVDGLKNKKRRKKSKRKDREIANSTAEQRRGTSDDSTELGGDVSSKGQNQVIENTDPELQQNDVVRAERVVTVDAVGAELNIRENVRENKINVSSKSKTLVDEQAKQVRPQENEQIPTCTSNLYYTATEGARKSDDTVKKPVSIVKLGGKVYLNGICDFDLPQPKIDRVDLTKIPSHLMESVIFLPIPGANVDEFRYVGLNYNKA